MGVATDSTKLIMQKSKSALSSGGRLNPRKIWRSRSKSQSRVNGSSSISSMWTSQGSGIWTSSSNGRQVVLTDTTLLSLTEAEVAALRHVALTKLQAMDLGCNVSLPKSTDDAVTEKPKRRALILKKRAVTTTGFFEHGNKDTGNGSRSSGLVFGVPLGKCVRQDRSAKRSASAPLDDQAAALLAARLKTGSASAEDITNERLLPSRGFTGSQTSCNIPVDIPLQSSGMHGRNDDGSLESLGLVCKSRSVSGLSMMDELQDWALIEGDVDQSPHVPNIVDTCFRHLETYGLHRLGIFRVSSSKKRVRQLREDFDSGKEVHLSKEHCPHDVATLLKEYFRDLPEPLLTRNLYLGFVATQKIRNRRQQMDALKYLIDLLPVANRDTLYSLLKFLATVASYAVDQRIKTGEWVAGNKMDANNLATLFGPNILHMAKSGTSQTNEYQVENVKRAEERIDIIRVVRLMIENYKELFEIPASLLDETYLFMLKNKSEDLGRLLQTRLIPIDYEIDPDTGSSACSETASISQVPIDVSMEVSAPLVISVSSDGSPKTAAWDRSLSHTESLPDDNLTSRRKRRDSDDADRPTRAGSLGREVFAKTESVASRLFRRRDKSAVRIEADGKENRSSVPKEEEPSRWFRKKGERSGSGGCTSSKDFSKAPEAEDNKKKQKTKSSYGRGSLSDDGNVMPSLSASKIASSVDSAKSHVRPLMFQEVVVPQVQQQQQQQEVSVVDIRKEHLNVPKTSQRRLSTPDLDNTAVISASLTLKVPLSRSQTGPSLAFGQDRDIDIPFIEDSQPEAVETPKLTTSHLRHRYLERRHRSSPFFQKPGGTDDDTTTVATTVVRTRHRPSVSEGTRTSKAEGEDRFRKSGQSSASKRADAGGDQSTTVVAAQSQRGVDGGRRSSAGGQWPQETWKRWEIISSEHTEQETVV